MATPVKQTAQHLGTKTIAMFLGMLLATIYAILRFFASPSLALPDLYNIALVSAFFAIVWTAVIFIAQLLKSYAHKVFNKVKTADVEDIGALDISMFLALLLAYIYAILQFFANPLLSLPELYNIGLVTAFFAIVWHLVIVIAIMMWTYAHSVSEKVLT